MDGKDVAYRVRNGVVEKPWAEKSVEQTALFDEPSLATDRALPALGEESQAISTETKKTFWEVFLPGEIPPEKEPSSSFNAFSTTASEITDRENKAAAEMYDKMLAPQASIETLANKPELEQKAADQVVATKALEHQLTRTNFDRIIAQGPYVREVQTMASKNKIFIEAGLREAGVLYQQDMGEAYAKKQAELKPVQAEVAKDSPGEVVHIDNIKAGLAEPNILVDLAKKHIGVDVGDVASKFKAKFSKLQSAKKNLTTIAGQVKAKGLGQWAKDQIPSVQEAAVKLASDKGAELKEWADQEFPKWQERAIADTKIITDAIDRGIKHLPQTRVDEISKAAKDVVGVMNPGKSSYKTEKFDIRVKGDDVAIYLNDFEQTPAIKDGKLNYDISLASINSLNKLPEKVESIKADVAQHKTARSYQAELLEK
jgi:hypothetical protein